jgi:hypothetical protein
MNHVAVVKIKKDPPLVAVRNDTAHAFGMLPARIMAEQPLLEY